MKRVTPSKMNSALATESLASDLEEALTLLTDYRQNSSDTTIAEPLPSLLEQCKALCSNFSGPEPIRSIHHFACTGGTMISKCLAALPNVALLSEIDPISRMQVLPSGAKPVFAPTDILLALRHSERRIDDSIIISTFRAAIDSASTELARQGIRLVIRDHAHSQFCTQVDAARRPTLYEILNDVGPTLSLITVRHPLDSFLALEKNIWKHFVPFTLEEYSQRYISFLDRHDGLPMISYESIVADAQAELERICIMLKLPFHSLALDLIGAIRLTGDSGRSGQIISARPRRETSEEITRQREGTSYRALCARMGYEA